MTVAVTHTRAADGTFSADGAAAWNAAHTFTAAANSVLFGNGSGVVADDSTNLLYTTSSGPRLQVGSGSGTSAGWISGYAGISGSSMLWSTGVTPSTSNFALWSQTSGGTVYLGGTSQCAMAPGGTIKALTATTGGFGLDITSGTATAAGVHALRVTRTNNNANVDTGVVFSFTDTTSAAGFLPLNILGGAAASTTLFNVSKTGGLTSGTPNGGTAAAWKFGAVSATSPTSPDRTIELDVGGTTYYLHAKTTNN